MRITDEQKKIVKEYGHLFNNTGGNDPLELIEREGVTYFNNVVVAELQGCCYAQVLLIQRLMKEGLLPTDCSAPDPADFVPPWPCQQLHGGRPPYIYQGCDPDTGLCHHEECNPANDDRVPNKEVSGGRSTSAEAGCSAGG